MKDYKSLTDKTVGCFKYGLKDHKAKVGDVNSYKKRHMIIVTAPIQKDICSDNLFIPQTEYYVKQLYGDEEVEQIIKERDEYKHRAEEAEARIAELKGERE